MVIRDKATKQQQVAANHTNGPAVLDACAGSGKSTTLANAVRNACSRGVPVHRIQMVTFNNNAAEHMAEKLNHMFGITGAACDTLHSYGLKIVKSHYELLGFASEPKFSEKKTAKLLGVTISKVASNKGVAAKRLKAATQKVRMQGHKPTCIKNDATLCDPIDQVLAQYQAAKLRYNLIDYADMVSLPVALFKEHPDILAETAAGIDLFLVDEVQDLTMLEASLVCYLAKTVKTALLAGDPKQIIYGFKGSSLKVWNKIVKYLDPHLYTLSESFRVPKANLPLVNAVGEDIWSGQSMISHQKGQKPCLLKASSNEEQAALIAEKIKSLQALGVPLTDIAIIGHTRHSLVLLKDTGSLKGLPLVETYRTAKPGTAQKLLRGLIRIVKWHLQTGGASGFKAVNALTMLLKAIGVPKETRKEILVKIQSGGWENMHIAKKPNEPRYRRVLAVKSAVIKASKMSPEAGMQLLIDALKPIAINKIGKKEKLAILCELSEVKLAVRECAAWNDVEIKNLPMASTKAGVSLATAHGAKGKEWPYVFVINLIEGEFPHRLSNGKTEFEEERRLFYVAITRASRCLYFIECPVHRNIFTKGTRKKLTVKFDQRSSLLEAYDSYLKLI